MENIGMSKFIVSLLTGFVLAGCGAAPGDSAEVEGELADEASIGTSEEALVPDNCGLIRPQSSTRLTVGATGSQVATKSPPYGGGACTNAAAFDLQHFNGRAGTTVAYAGALPTNESDCRRIEVSQITYDNFGTQVGSRTRKFGGWSGGSCLFPITSNSGPLPAGQHRQWVQALNAAGQPVAVRVTLFALP
jgi:hypothetical protein